MQKAQRSAGLQSCINALASEISSYFQGRAFTPFAGYCSSNLGPIALIPGQLNLHYRDVMNDKRPNGVAWNNHIGIFTGNINRQVLVKLL